MESEDGAARPNFNFGIVREFVRIFSAQILGFYCYIIYICLLYIFFPYYYKSFMFMITIT